MIAGEGIGIRRCDARAKARAWKRRRAEALMTPALAWPARGGRRSPGSS